MNTRTTLTERIPERTTPLIEADLVDGSGANIPSPLTMTGLIYDVRTGTVLRAEFDLLPFLTVGHLAIYLGVEDTRILKDKKDYEEQHRLLVEWTWSLGTKAGAHEIDHYVFNFQKVPT